MQSAASERLPGSHPQTCPEQTLVQWDRLGTDIDLE